MPLIDASAYGFTWSDKLHLRRLALAQAPREGLVDRRAENLYDPPGNFPWNVLANPGWRMPPAPLSSRDKVYLSEFMNTSVDSFRAEPYIFALRPQGANLIPGSTAVEGGERMTRGQQRMGSLAFHTSGRMNRVYSNEGWTFTDPQLPPNPAGLPTAIP